MWDLYWGLVKAGERMGVLDLLTFNDFMSVLYKHSSRRPIPLARHELPSPYSESEEDQECFEEEGGDVSLDGTAPTESVTNRCTHRHANQQHQREGDLDRHTAKVRWCGGPKRR